MNLILADSENYWLEQKHIEPSNELYFHKIMQRFWQNFMIGQWLCW